MEVSSATQASAADLNTQVANQVQKIAQDTQAQVASQLVNSLPEPPPLAEPGSTVGSQVNIFA